MKRQIQLLNRSLHEAVLKRPLAEKIAPYFHSFEKAYWEPFRAMVDHLRQEGYRFEDPRGFLSARGEKVAFLSFDDNYRSWYEALEFLGEIGVTATFYVNTAPFRDRSNEPDVQAYFDRINHQRDRVTLSTGELKEIASAGHLIACHSHSHFNLAQISETQRGQEIGESKAILEDILGQPVLDFSYPFGMRRYFSEELRAYCLDQGFTTVANAIPAMQYQEQRADAISRSGWDLGQSLDYNLTNLRIDGRLFERLTGRSPVI